MYSIAQLKRLLELAERTADWNVEPDNNDAIFVSIYPYSLNAGYERIIEEDGTVKRYDQDTDKTVPADLLTPETGTFTSPRTGRTTTYYY